VFREREFDALGVHSKGVLKVRFSDFLLTIIFNLSGYLSTNDRAIIGRCYQLGIFHTESL
jgi:hypothetical protein